MSKNMIELIKKIGARDGIGDLLAEGALRAAQKIGGSDFVVHSKGLDYPAVDIRGTKGMALSFAVPIDHQIFFPTLLSDGAAFLQELANLFFQLL